MKTFVALLLGIFLGLGIYWFLTNKDVQNEMKEMGDEISTDYKDTGQETNEAEHGIDTDKIKRGIKEAGKSIAEFGEDAALTTKIKAKLAAAEGVPALSIDVDTNNGVVTLSGTVSSSDQIGKAVEIAKSVQGVRKVISTVQIDSEGAETEPGEQPKNNS